MDRQEDCPNGRLQPVGPWPTSSPSGDARGLELVCYVRGFGGRIMAYYVILSFDIDDSTEFQKYQRLAAPTLPAAVKVLAFDDERNDLEGKSHERLVILEFETEGAALEWYRSDAYQAAAQHRRASTRGWIRGVNQFARRGA